MLPPPHFHNRIASIAAHTSRYGFRSLPRLAQDTGISRSALYRMVQGETRPRLDQAQRIVQALSQALKMPLSLDEVYSADDRYPTESACTLCGCQGCRMEQMPRRLSL